MFGALRASGAPGLHNPPGERRSSRAVTAAPRDARASAGSGGLPPLSAAHLVHLAAAWAGLQRVGAVVASSADADRVVRRALAASAASLSPRWSSPVSRVTGEDEAAVVVADAPVPPAAAFADPSFPCFFWQVEIDAASLDAADRTVSDAPATTIDPYGDYLAGLMSEGGIYGAAPERGKPAAARDGALLLAGLWAATPGTLPSGLGAGGLSWGRGSVAVGVGSGSSDSGDDAGVGGLFRAGWVESRAWAAQDSPAHAASAQPDAFAQLIDDAGGADAIPSGRRRALLLYPGAPVDAFDPAAPVAAAAGGRGAWREARVLGVRPGTALLRLAAAAADLASGAAAGEAGGDTEAAQLRGELLHVSVRFSDGCGDQREATLTISTTSQPALLSSIVLPLSALPEALAAQWLARRREAAAAASASAAAASSEDLWTQRGGCVLGTADRPVALSDVLHAGAAAATVAAPVESSPHMAQREQPSSEPPATATIAPPGAFAAGFPPFAPAGFMARVPVQAAGGTSDPLPVRVRPGDTLCFWLDVRRGELWAALNGAPVTPTASGAAAAFSGVWGARLFPALALSGPGCARLRARMAFARTPAPLPAFAAAAVAPSASVPHGVEQAAAAAAAAAAADSLRWAADGGRIRAQVELLARAAAHARSPPAVAAPATERQRPCGCWSRRPAAAELCEFVPGLTLAQGLLVMQAHNGDLQVRAGVSLLACTHSSTPAPLPPFLQAAAEWLLSRGALGDALNSRLDGMFGPGAATSADALACAAEGVPRACVDRSHLILSRGEAGGVGRPDGGLVFIEHAVASFGPGTPPAPGLTARIVVSGEPQLLQ